MKKRMMLYFGSFDPIHKGHIALAEYAIDKGLGDEVAMIVSPQNPFKAATLQTPEMDRFEMAEMACADSRYPEQIRPSAIEFMLEKPSYTIRTLDYLRDNFGAEMEFAIMIGSDNTARLDEWRDYERILAEYPIYVYPRRGAEVEKFRDRVHLLEDAPLVDFSSTDVRQAAERGQDVAPMVGERVAEYIRRKQLWTPAGRIVRYTSLIEQQPDCAELYVERGKCYFQHNEWGNAINDFNRALKLDPQCGEAKQFIEMAEEILAFRYTDIYNP